MGKRAYLTCRSAGKPVCRKGVGGWERAGERLARKAHCVCEPASVHEWAGAVYAIQG